MSGGNLSVEISDPRTRDRHLRVTWHRERRVVVFSQWRDGICVATTPIELAELPELIGLFVRALQDATSTTQALPTAIEVPPTFGSLVRNLRRVLHRRVPSQLAATTALRHVKVDRDFDSPSNSDNDVASSS